MLCKSDCRTNVSCKITEPGSGDPIVSASARKGNWQGMCVGDVGTRKEVRPRETWQAPIVETGIRQGDLMSGKRQKLMVLELGYKGTGWFSERLGELSLVQELACCPWEGQGRAAVDAELLLGPQTRALGLCTCLDVQGTSFASVNRKSYVSAFFLNIYVFWGIVGLQCFRCTTRWFSYTYAHIYASVLKLEWTPPPRVFSEGKMAGKCSGFIGFLKTIRQELDFA